MTYIEEHKAPFIIIHPRNKWHFAEFFVLQKFIHRFRKESSILCHFKENVTLTKQHEIVMNTAKQMFNYEQFFKFYNSLSKTYPFTNW